MLIHDKFKEELMKIWAKTLKDRWLENMMDEPNDKILHHLLESFRVGLSDQIMLSEEGWQLRARDITDIRAIDDEFMWTNRWIVRWMWLSDLISAKYMSEEKTFEKWDILKVVPPAKLRMLSLTNMAELSGKYFEMIWYQGWSWTVHVRVKDFYWNDFSYPQRAFIKTSETSLKDLFMEHMKKKVMWKILDAKKHKVDTLTQNYQTTLREYLKASKLLSEANQEDLDKRAEEVVQGHLDFNDKFKNFPQIRNVKFVDEENVEIITKCIYSEQDKKMPLGRFKIQIKSGREFKVVIKNLDITDNAEHNHMHVHRSWDVCRWDWIKPMKIANDRGDFMSMVLTVIDFLEHYNPDSPYINREEYLSRRKRTMTNVVKLEEDETDEKKKLVVDDKLVEKVKKWVRTVDPMRDPMWMSTDLLNSIEAERARQMLDRAMQDYTNQNNAIVSMQPPTSWTTTTNTNTPVRTNIDPIQVDTWYNARPRQRASDIFTANLPTNE